MLANRVVGEPVRPNRLSAHCVFVIVVFVFVFVLVHVMIMIITHLIQLSSPPPYDEHPTGIYQSSVRRLSKEHLCNIHPDKIQVLKA